MTASDLVRVLRQAVTEGYLTPGAADEGPAHSAGFLRFAARSPDDQRCTAVDLGSGGGLPGLPLALATAWRWLLVDRSETRCDHLRWAVEELDLAARVTVIEADASVFGHGPQRGEVDVVVARSFAPPAVLAECAAPLLRPGGRLIVSEPPEDGVDSDRWPDEVSVLGLTRRTGGAGYAVLERTGDVPDRVPRRFRQVTRAPLF